MADGAGKGLVDQVRSIVANRLSLGEPSGSDPESKSESDTERAVRRRDVDSGERILAALQARGGRAKQSDLVEDVRWSKSTVSRQLSELEAAGAVVRYTIGNEKLVMLPETVPDGSAGEADDERPDEMSA